MIRRTLILAAVTILMVAPTSLGAWSSFGGREPDTLLDIEGRNALTDTGAFNHFTPDRTPTAANGGGIHKVYFNGFRSVCNWPLCTGVSPNVGAESLRSGLYGHQQMHMALLGVWKDCNKDGYVGYGDNGLFQYRVELLQGDVSVCKAEAYKVNPDPVKGYGIIHNDGAWVSEFIPISWRYYVLEVNPFNINDNGARMWMDGGVPGADPGQDAGGCYLYPQPRGTFHNAGGVVRSVDCHANFVFTDTTASMGDDVGDRCVAAANQPPQCIPATGIGLDNQVGQITFSDKPRDQETSSSQLNVKPWGEESDKSYVSMWDCSTHQSITANGAPVANVTLPTTSPSTYTGDDASISGTMNETGSGFDKCERNTDQNDQMHVGGSLALAPYALEGDVTQPATYKAATTVMVPREGQRPNPPSALLGKGTPPDFGTHYINSNRDLGDIDVWDDNTAQIRGAPSVDTVTFYAYVSSTAVTTYGLTMPKGTATGKYGAEACGTLTSGTRNNWTCDSTKWWRGFVNGAEEDVEPRSTYIGEGSDERGIPVGARVHSLYNLRDVDCYDFSAKPLRDAGVNADTAGYHARYAQWLARSTYGPIVNSVAPGAINIGNEPTQAKCPVVP